MVKIRHVNARTLKEAESLIEALSMKTSLVIIGVNNVSGSWFIHYLLQLSDTPLTTKIVKSEGTKTLKGKK